MAENSDVVRPAIIPDLRDEPWTVSADFAGDHWQVHPGRGLLCEEEWGMNVKKPWRMLTPWMMVRYLVGVSFRLSYPRSERGLRRSVAACQMWCDRMNAYEARERAIGKAVL